MPKINDTAREAAFHHFLDLIEILDSFDHCSKLALALDCLYSPTDYEHKPLFAALEKVVLHLRSLRTIGSVEVPCPGCFGPCGNSEVKSE